MCGRYGLYADSMLTMSSGELRSLYSRDARSADPPDRVVRQILAELNYQGVPLHGPAAFDARPTDPMPIIVAGEPEGVRARWGLLPPWWKSPGASTYSTFNATIEKFTDPKSMWSKIFPRTRCVVPMRGFYEWQRQPDGSTVRHWIRLVDDGMFVCAGLWAVNEHLSGSVTFTIATCPANPLMAKIHNKPRQGGPRMPAILDRDEAREWLAGGELATPERRAAHLELLRPFPQERMVAHPVANKGAGPELVKAIGPRVNPN